MAALTLRALPSIFVLAVILILSFHGTHSKAAVPTVGVAFSNQTHQYLIRTGRSSAVLTRAQRVTDVLESKGLSVSKVGDDVLGNLSALLGYDVIVLPNVFVLTAAQSLALKEYVARGGAIISIFGVPRVQPDNSVWGGKELMNHEAWEYGPLSQVYQIQFMDDAPWASGYTLSAENHPIITATAQAAGRPVELIVKKAAGVEETKILRGNTNVSPILNFQSTGMPAAYAGQYKKGKFVYFSFLLMTFFTDSDVISDNSNQGEMAQELLNQAVRWAAADAAKSAPIGPRAKTWANVDAWGKSVYVRQYVAGIGNVQTTGTLSVQIYNPAGKLVYTQKKLKLGTVPAEANNVYSWGYTPGTLLAKGRWRVVVNYSSGYPRETDLWQEVAYFTGKGKNIPTVKARERYTGDAVPYNGPTTGSSNSGTVSTTIDETNESIIYRWDLAAHPQASGTRYSRTNTPGASAEFGFKGSEVTWITAVGPDQGIANLYLDGTLVRTVDNYAATAKFADEVALNGLSDTAHVLKVVVTGRKNTASKDSMIAVDAFKVANLAFQNDIVATKGPGVNFYLLYSWASQPFSGALRGRVTWTRFKGETGDKFILPFRGNKVIWYTFMGPNMGIASVYLDGTFQKVVNLYSPTFKRVPISFGGLASGVTHRFEVRATGSKTAASKAAYISIDALSY